MNASSPPSRLSDLRGLRSAPPLDAAIRQELGRELAEAMAPYAWFTIGVMAPSAAAAVTALRSCEAALGWPPLTEPVPAGEAADGQGPADAPDGADSAGSVFLKGNQRTGSYRLRPESGLGEGILISGHHAEDPNLGETWGPLPLDWFEQADA
jgi:hypothetical protein